MPLPADPIRTHAGLPPVRPGRADSPQPRPLPRQLLSRATPATPGARPQSVCGSGPGRECDSRDLLAGAREILIRHGGELYRLRHTRNDKLILTK